MSQASYIRWARSIGLALLATAVAALLTSILPISREVPFLALFVLVVLGSAWYGGWLGGISATLFSVLAMESLLSPAARVMAGSTENLIRMVGYSLMSVLVTGLVTAARGRVESRRELSATEERYRTLFENSPHPMWIFDRETLRFLEVNHAAVEHYGYSREEFLSMTIREIRPPEELSRLQDRLAQKREETIRHAGLWKHRSKDGRLSDVEITAHRLDWQGRPATLVLVDDVTERKLAEGALRESEAKFRALADTASCAIVVLQGEKLRYANRFACELTGHSAEELRTMTFFDLVHPDYREQMRQRAAARLRGEDVPSRYEAPILTRQGSTLWLDVAAARIIYEGQSAGLLTAIDVTHRKKAEEALRESEERFRSLIENATVGIYRTTPDGRILMANPALIWMLGYDSFQELASRNLESDGYHPDYPRSAFRERAEREGVISGIESVWTRRDGTVIVVRESVRTIRGAGGAVLYYDGVVEDFSDRKRADETLRKSEEIYRQAIENAAGVPFRLIFGPTPGTGYYDYVGSGITRLLGLAPAEFTEERFQEMVKEVVPLSAVIPLDPEECRRAMLGGKIHQYRADVRIRTTSGEEKWLQDTSLPLRDEHSGKIVGALGILMDVTERKRAEQLQWAVYQIAEAASRAGSLDELYEAVHQVIGEVMPAQNFYIAQYDEEENRLSFPYFVDETGSMPAPRPPGKGLTPYVLFTGKSLLCTPEVCKELCSRGEVELVGEPSQVWLGVPLRVAEKTIGVMVVQDYSNRSAYGVREQQVLEFVSSHVAEAIVRKRAEQALHESEARYRELVQHARYGIFRSTVDGALLEVNPAMVSMLGYDSKEELLSRNLATDIYLREGDRAALLETISESGVLKGAEVEWKRKEGQPITVSLSGRALNDKQGKIAYFESIAENVTERRLLENQFRQAQKMEAVGRLAGGVAHDFNNLLMVITGYGELLRDRLATHDPNLKNLDEILKAAERAAALTRQLLAFSRRQVLEPKVVNLNDVVVDVDKMLRRLIGEDIELVTRLGPHLRNVRADPGQLEQVLMNLAVNSRDAMPRGGRLVIETSNIDVDEEFAASHLGMQPGSWVSISTSDTGVGMGADTLAHIFEPFFTTKEKGKGTGLGLATVYGIVKQSGGYINVYSEPGRGTTFTAYLPCVDQSAPPTAERAKGAVVTGGSETILLVEDEASVRELGYEVLLAKGYTVLTATSADEALVVALRHAGPIHLLLTDLILPGRTGRELAEKLSAVRPETKIVYMSGYTEDTFLHQEGLPPSTAFLQKPFSPATLARKIRDALDAA